MARRASVPLPSWQRPDRRSTVLEPFGALIAAAFVLYAALMVMLSESHR